MGDSQIGVVAVPLLIVGIVQAVKKILGWKGDKVRALAMGLGVFFVGLATCLEQGLFTPEVAVLIEMAVYALAGGLAALGYYDLGKKFRPAAPSPLTYQSSTSPTTEAEYPPCLDVPVSPATETLTAGEYVIADYIITDGRGWFLVQVVDGKHPQLVSDRAQAAHMSIVEAMDTLEQLPTLTRDFPAGSRDWQILADSDEAEVPERFAPVCKRAANE